MELGGKEVLLAKKRYFLQIQIIPMFSFNWTNSLGIFNNVI